MNNTTTKNIIMKDITKKERYDHCDNCGEPILIGEPSIVLIYQKEIIIGPPSDREYKILVKPILLNLCIRCWERKNLDKCINPLKQL